MSAVKKREAGYVVFFYSTFRQPRLIGVFETGAQAHRAIKDCGALGWAKRMRGADFQVLPILLGHTYGRGIEAGTSDDDLPYEMIQGR